MCRTTGSNLNLPVKETDQDTDQAKVLSLDALADRLKTDLIT